MSGVDADYFRKFKRSRPWRPGGDQPVTYRTWLRELRRKARVRDGTLIDCGCGEGYLLRRASTSFVTVGVDLSAAGLETARRVAPKATLLRASVTQLPFSDASADVLVAADVVEHLPNPALFFNEARRVLRPRGVMLLSTPNPLSLGARLKGSDWFAWKDPTHISIMPPAEWRKHVESAGLVVVSEGTDALWDTPYVRFAEKLQWLVLITLKHLMLALRPHYPWSIGENYIAIVRRG